MQTGYERRIAQALQLKTRVLNQHLCTPPNCNIPKNETESYPQGIQADPIKVMSAYGLEDDFYQSPLTWCTNDKLLLGMAEKIYSYDVIEGTKNILLSITTKCSSIAQNGNQLAVGCKNGMFGIYDLNTLQTLSSLKRIHEGRIGVTAWHNPFILATASKDMRVIIHDTRQASSISFAAHRQEVCGLAWEARSSNTSYGASHSSTLLATGGNDNDVHIWDIRRLITPTCTQRHLAAVKAIAWNPHQRNWLATGGGTADRVIRIWSTSGHVFESSPFVENEKRSGVVVMETGSQVCCLAWNPYLNNELLSAHGYSENHLFLWQRIVDSRNDSKGQLVCPPFMGHEQRALYMAVSPDGLVATAGGDETLRVWRVFRETRRTKITLV